jgi:8-hydroxy-5-deazaflavin:NADPH oxidoreductase
MRIAILGAGTIGTTIARRWQQAGHDIVYGVRDPDADRYRDLPSETIPQAVSKADATLIAIPGEAVESLLDTQRESLDGALLLDATNNVSSGSFHQFSLFESRLPAARVYRAFSTLGWENFADPLIGGERADLFYSGPDGTDRAMVKGLIGDVGLRAVYVGAGPAGWDLLDGVTRLWFTLALQQGHGRHLAFRTLGLPAETEL